MSYKVDGYEVEFIKYGFISIFELSTNQYMKIDTKEQARDIAYAILIKCHERERESEE